LRQDIIDLTLFEVSKEVEEGGHDFIMDQGSGFSLNANENARNEQIWIMPCPI